MAGTIGPLLAEGSVDRYRPLGAFGKPAHQSYVQLRAALMARLGPSYANYFARPTFDIERRSLRWNAEIAGDAVTWRDLPADEQVRLTPKLQRIREGLLGYIGELNEAARKNQAGGGQALASLLEQAMTVPDESHLHVLEGQPVLSFWGFEQQSGASTEAAAVAAPIATPIPIVDPVPVVPVVVPPPGPVGRGAWGWLRWLLLALLLLLLLAILAWFLRCTQPLAGWFAQGGFPANWLPELTVCPQQIAPVIEPPKPPVVEPPKPPVIDPPKPPVDPKRMTIPEDSLKTRDLSFLKGRWQIGEKMRIGLPDGTVVGEMVNSFQFDENGRGYLESEKVTGATGSCRGPARARFDGDVLRIDTEHCAGRNHDLVGMSFECRRAPDGRSICNGTNKENFAGKPAEKFNTWLTQR